MTRRRRGRASARPHGAAAHVIIVGSWGGRGLDFGGAEPSPIATRCRAALAAPCSPHAAVRLSPDCQRDVNSFRAGKRDRTVDARGGSPAAPAVDNAYRPAGAWLTSQDVAADSASLTAFSGRPGEGDASCCDPKDRASSHAGARRHPPPHRQADGRDSHAQRSAGRRGRSGQRTSRPLPARSGDNRAFRIASHSQARQAGAMSAGGRATSPGSEWPPRR